MLKKKGFVSFVRFVFASLRSNNLLRYARSLLFLVNIRHVRHASAWRPFLVVPPDSIGLSKFKSLLGLLARLGQLFLLFRKAVEEPTYSPLQSPHNQSTKNLPSGPHRDLVGSIILLGFVLCDTLSLTFYSSKIVPIHHILPKSHYPEQNSHKPHRTTHAREKKNLDFGLWTFRCIYLKITILYKKIQSPKSKSEFAVNTTW